MEIRWGIFIIIVGCAIVTFIPRVVPLMVLTRLHMPGWAMRWLNYVPISVMAALIGQEILMKDGKISLVNNVELLAAIPTFLIAWKTRSLLGTVIGGIISVIIIQQIGLYVS